MTTGTAGGGAPPTEIERELGAAAGGSGYPAAGGRRLPVLRALSRVRLYLLTARVHADSPGLAAPLPTRRDSATGQLSVPVLTAGMLPPWHPEWVFRETGLAELARIWPDGARLLAVNPGTPYAATLAARPSDRREWPRIAASIGGPPRNRLLTHADGPLYGPLAHGLALGGQLAVRNGIVWNQLGAAYVEYGTDRAWLRDPWGVGNRAGYERVVESLIATRLVGRTHESVLRTRRALADRLGRTPAEDEWSAEVVETLSRRGAPGADFSAAAESMRRVTEYEGRLRADGLLTPGGRVDTLASFDHGRAVNVVRLALGARYCDPAGAERAVLRIGEAARRAYDSWTAFSLGYTLTRLIHFDGDPDGGAYHDLTAPHRILAQDPMSPYRNIPWS
ncbi:hypothetical protein GCM10010387_25730 [Streptomyces inusitatus]|uniref:DUF1266 domain-containing protein n=1 Tax=Streptomyces inusitatus TaxID=68221 RepID=A0A918Q4U8_9ACTN|nr:DUF1266 domain-containing protein [Streptomyces inusitatus]GGZ30872.1 hypothetical protein GCM10010387_25730 [Streptomyces inusitatus]